MVRQAITLDANWRRPAAGAAPYKEAFVPTNGRVLEIAMLSGGQFLVAAIEEATDLQYSIAVVSLDFPTPRNNWVVAKMRCASRPYQLRAEWQRRGGETGIVMAFIQRTSLQWRSEAIEEAYEFTCLYSPFEGIECILGHGSRMPTSGPFVRWMHTIRAEEMMDLSLYVERDDTMCASLVLKPDVVMLANLTRGTTHELRCSPAPVAYMDVKEHTIHAIRVLPSQQGILVIGRFAYVDIASEVRTTSLSLEIHQYDPAGTGLSMSVCREASDLGVDGDVAEGPFISSFHGFEEPLAIFVRGTGGTGFHQFSLSPLSVNDTLERRAVYRPEGFVNQGFHQAPGFVRVLPGTHRTLAYTVLADSPDVPRTLNAFGRVVYTDQPNLTQVCGEAKGKLAWRQFSTRWEVSEGMGTKLINAIAWEEKLGRVCVALGDEGIVVVDFGQVFRQDTRIL